MAIPTTTTKQPQHAYAVPNSNHFVYAKLNRADHAESVELDMLIGNKYALAWSATVKIVDGALEITLDGKGSFGAIAFKQPPVVNNDNIHSQKVANLAKFGATTIFSHDNKTNLPCPTGDTTYLYIHCDKIQVYQ